MRQLDQVKRETGNSDMKLVVSMSYAGPMDASHLWLDPGEEYMDFFYARGDVLFVASAGNEGGTPGGNLTMYPAGYRNAISVAALGRTPSGPANFSQSNADVELAAPGVDVLSILPDYIQTAIPIGPQLATSPSVEGLQQPPPLWVRGSRQVDLTGAPDWSVAAGAPCCTAQSARCTNWPGLRLLTVLTAPRSHSRQAVAHAASGIRTANVHECSRCIIESTVQQTAEGTARALLLAGRPALPTVTVTDCTVHALELHA